MSKFKSELDEVAKETESLEHQMIGWSKKLQRKLGLTSQDIATALGINMCWETTNFAIKVKNCNFIAKCGSWVILLVAYPKEDFNFELDWDTSGSGTQTALVPKKHTKKQILKEIKDY